MSIFKNLFINKSIRWKFVVYTVLPIVIIFCIFLGFTVSNLEKLSASNIEADVLDTVTIMGNRLDRELGRLAHMAIMNKHYLEISPQISGEMAYALTRKTVESQQLIYGAAIAFEPDLFSPDRKLFSPYSYRSGTDIYSMDIGDEGAGTGYDYTSGEWEWWTAPRQSGASLWTAPYFDEGAGNIIMSTYSVPFFRGDKFLGVATVDVALESLFELLGILQEGNNVIVSREGKFIHYHDPGFILNRSIYDLTNEYTSDSIGRLMAQVTAGNAGLYKLSRADGNDLIWAFYTPIPSTGWYYIYFLAEDQALAFTRYQWKLFVVMFALTVLLIVGIIWFMSGLLTSPIRELHSAAEKVSKGDFDIWVKYKSRDELGKLTSVFNKMASVLGSREEDLERKVEARTNELQSTQIEITKQNEVLEQRINELAEARKVSNSMMQEAELARAELANQLALQQALLDTIPNPIFYKDADTRFLGVNKAYEEAFNIKAKDQIGLRTLDLHYLAEEDRRNFQAICEDTIKNPKTIRWETQIPFADGKVHDTLFGMSVFRKSDGSVGGLVGTFIDISEQKQITKQAELAREKLADQLSLQQALIDTIPNPIFYKDADTRFIGFNKAYEETFNIKSKDLIGLRVLDLEYLPEDDRKLYQAEDEDTVKNQRNIRREMQMPFSDGKVHDTLYWVSGFRKGDGSPGGLIGTFIDISDQKEIAKQLEIAKNAAEAATQAKASFLASMSHEIRTPMNGILGMVELLRQSDLSEEHRKMLRTVYDSGRSLLTIINDILDFSKIEAGKLELEAIPVSLIDAVEGTAETLAPVAQNKGLKLITYIDPGIPKFVMGDMVRIRQILINLGGNAIKFTDMGEVVIQASKIEPGTDGKINVRFSVIDKGIGISESAQKDLFKAFTQAESSTTRKYGGTGLGLSICQRLAQMMGGEIGVRSELGVGSEFFVTIPFARSDKDPIVGDTKKLSRLSVAVASGSDIELLACTKYLEYWDASVSAFKDMDQAIAEIRAMLAGKKQLDIFVLGSSRDYEQQKEVYDSLKNEPAFSKVNFVFLVLGRYRNKPRVVDERLVTIDISPLMREPFISAVAIAAGRESPEVRQVEHLEDMKAEKVQTAEDALVQGTLILVVEDNPTNQDVITRQLTMLGYACEVTNNGRQALEALGRKNYGIMLTDCHMPEMDGYELTATVREQEKTTGKHIPIVAITANALQGEAEKCIAAGMDDYLSKPIKIRELRKKLQEWLPELIHADDNKHRKPAAAKKSGKKQKPLPENNFAVDESVLREMFGDDDTVKEILADFVQPSLQIVKAIKAGVAAGSAEKVMQAAHKLKSAARSVGANSLADLCQHFENAGKSGDIQHVSAKIATLDNIMLEVISYIDTL